MEHGLNFGTPKYRKFLEAGFLALGLILFIALGARGIQNIRNATVIAGQQNRSYTAGSGNYAYSLPVDHSLSRASAISPLSLPGNESNDTSSSKVRAKDAADSSPKELPEKAADTAKFVKRVLEDKAPPK